MFKCSVCDKVYTAKSALSRHEKSHQDVKFSCGVCQMSFTRKDNLSKHVQEKHHSTKYSVEYNVATNFTPASTNALTTASTSALDLTPVATSKHLKRTTVVSAPKRARMQSVTGAGFVETRQSMKRGVVWYFKKNTDNALDYQKFLNDSKRELTEKLTELSNAGPIKYNLKLESTYNIPHLENSNANRAFKTSAKPVFPHSDVESMINEDFATLLAEEDAYAGRGSGYALAHIDGLLLGVYMYNPLSASSYLGLPPEIVNKRAVINPQNTDQMCFKWAILAKHVNSNARVNTVYVKEEYRYDFSGLTFPTPVSEIKIFERNNPDTSVNVYGLKYPESHFDCLTVFPLRVVDEEKTDHFDLLFITNEKNAHYAYISDLSRLVRAQKTLHKERIFMCKRCFSSFDEQPRKNGLCGREAYEQHKLFCNAHKLVRPVMPPANSVVEYADFEAILEKTSEKKGTNTEIFQSHRPMSYGFLVKAIDDVPAELLERYNIPRGPVVYRGNNAAKKFVKDIIEIGERLYQLLNTNTPIVMTNEDRRTHAAKSECDVCKSTFSIKNSKVADHCHLSGRFRNTLCNDCNLKLQKPNFVPCFLHNLSNYDAHFIVTELGYDAKRISVIPNSEEKYVTFSKYVNGDFSVRFIDTFRFMASSLSTLASNLMTNDFGRFRETARIFSPDDMSLVTRKGVYPYEYTDGWDKLEEDRLPPKEAFYSSLSETDVSDDDYAHANRVWEHFGCRNLGQYSDLYLKIDVLLLADVFENFRDVCLSAYNLDPAYYFTAPGFSFDCMLKHTKIKLELLSDYEMHLMFERGIRGGLVQASMRYAKANNRETAGFDDSKPSSWIIYLDCNNLYGYAMSRPQPYGGFRWYEGDPRVALSELDGMNETDKVGRIYEVDVSYPQHLHDAHNDIPFLPCSDVPPGSKLPKLMATLLPKKRYVVHYMNLKQAIANGLIVDKVHRVLEFNQSPWLAEYIRLNTEMRQRATNDFEKDFFKLMNNAVFGKTMENLRKRVKMELVSTPRRLQKLVNRPTFKHCTAYNEDLCLVSLENDVIKLTKPIYVGFCVLDLSKRLMYEYHYDVMKSHYEDAITLMYTDTDSLIYFVKTENFYTDLKNNANLFDRVDTANLPRDHPCYTDVRKKIPGFFSDEVDGKIINEFVALRAKSYAFCVEGKKKIKAKGVRRHVVQNHMTLEDHKRCLFGDDLDPYRENVSIRSYKHHLHTIKVNKLAYNCYDDKRVVLDDRVHTLAHGHYKIDEIGDDDEDNNLY